MKDGRLCKYIVAAGRRNVPFTELGSHYDLSFSYGFSYK